MFRKFIVAVTVAAALASGGVGSARATGHASTPANGTSTAASTLVTSTLPSELLAAEGLTAENYAALISDLKAAGYRAQQGLITVRVKGVALHLPEAKPTSGPSQLGGGWDGWRGPYISFNRVDQGALLAGGGAALAAAICLIPAVGQAACVAAAALVAIAFYYVTEYGRCPTNRQYLRVYVWSRGRGCHTTG